MSDDTSKTGPVRHVLHTADGLSLQAEMQMPSGSADTKAARVVLAHPHPQFGGNMYSLVISTLFTHLATAGHAVLRFNFRGVQDSEGEHDHGEGERLDVQAAVAAMAAVEAAGPVVLAGWSFGADVSLSVVEPELAGWFLVAPPLSVLSPERFVAAQDPRPKWFAAPGRDQFNPPDALRATTSSWRNVHVHEIAGADHFLVGRTDHLNTLIDEHLAELTD